MNTDHLHPLSVHFPIALIMAGFLFDLVAVLFCKKHELSKSGYYLIILGTLGAVFAYFTGEYFSKELTGTAGEFKEYHELIAKITMWLMIIITVLRVFMVYYKKDNSVLKWIILILEIAGVCCIAYTGYLGGQLVYDYML